MSIFLITDSMISAKLHPNCMFIQWFPSSRRALANNVHSPHSTDSPRIYITSNWHFPNFEKQFRQRIPSLWRVVRTHCLQVVFTVTSPSLSTPNPSLHTRWDQRLTSTNFSNNSTNIQGISGKQKSIFQEHVLCWIEGESSRWDWSFCD